MKILAIETSCDETAVAILKAEGKESTARFEIHGNALYSQAKKHAKYGGVYPTLAKREHAANIVPLLESALKEAEMYQKEGKRLTGEENEFLKKLLTRESEMFRAVVKMFENVKKPEVDAIAVTQGPGLEPALWVGINFARALGFVWDIPLLLVNHLEGHIIASSVKKEDDDNTVYTMTKTDFPVLGLILSGGHTEIVHALKWGDYSVVGATRDDSIGEAFDKVARLLNLPYPGGPELSNLAELGRKILLTRPAHLMKDMVKLPRPMISSNDLDFSFSGIKTAALYYVQKKGELDEMQNKLFSAEFEEAVSDVILKKVHNALEQYPSKTLVIGGGVSANKWIRTRLKKNYSHDTSEYTLKLPLSDLSTDNAVMIGMAGYFMHLRGEPVVQAKNDVIALGNMCLQK